MKRTYFFVVVAEEVSSTREEGLCSGMCCDCLVLPAALGQDGLWPVFGACS